jgi:hypothetical protein
MTMEEKTVTGVNKCSVAGAALALLVVSGGSGPSQVQPSRAASQTEKQALITTSKFYCNTKALNPTDPAQHKQLTDKLIATRKEIVETEKGYEFQFNPATIALAELADWVTAEAKCCPFFDFHIDLEREGSLLCLRLTGEDGIKTFIQAEFQVPAKP